MLAYNANLLTCISAGNNLGGKSAHVVTHKVISNLNNLLVVRLNAITISNSSLIHFADFLNHLSDVGEFFFRSVSFNLHIKNTFLT